MHSFILLTLTPLTLANNLFLRSYLTPRQGNEAFKPSSIPVYACQYPLCGTHWCPDPSNGDVCCTEGYTCPGESFCLTQGYCCPDGLDPATCAIQRGITLSPGFKAGQTVAIATAASTSTGVAATSPSSTAIVPTTSSKPSSSTPAPATPATISAATAPYPRPVANITLPPPSTATGVSPPGSSAVPFKGGAMRLAIDGFIGATVFGAVVLLM